MKEFHFISGLPRSGSTLLCNILCQNPRFHATSSSGVVEVFAGIKNGWNSVIEFKATPNDAAQKRVMRSVFDAFYEDIPKPVIFDKSRGWPKFIESLEYTFDKKIKIIACVRDVRDVVASFEKIWRRDSKNRLLPQERENPVAFQTTKGRVETWLSDKQPVGASYNYLSDAIKRGLKDRLHLVEFERLTQDPKNTLLQIYEFIKEPYFEHDFDNVPQVTKEDDTVYGFTDLHTIRSKVEPMEPQWPTVLGRDYEKLSYMNFWDK